MKPSVLIVDDDEEILTQMRWALTEDYEVFLAEDREKALEAFKSASPAVTILDLGLPPHANSTEEGMAALSAILACDDEAKVIIASGQGEKENALEAIGIGAYDFLDKPLDVDELRFLLKRCIYVADLEKDYRNLQQSFSVDAFEGIYASSSEMQEVFGMIRKVAKSVAPVLVLGESGTGKEMVARAIHNQSDEKENPFVAINCNAIPENLLESELFGHEKGSFTGAHAQRKGLIESAAGGTLFLDEIGELPSPIQVKLLRFLQEKRIQRVGGREEIAVDVRIVAATNANLKEAVKGGSFREDLYFRLAVVVMNLPPLRDRGDDVGLLAQEFLKQFSQQNGKKNLTFAAETLRAIRRYTWPGNVRELQNRVQRSVIMADGKRISAVDMELGELSDLLPVTTLKEAKEELERGMVQRALDKHAGKITAAAAELGISRPTFYELIDKLGIERK